MCGIAGVVDPPGAAPADRAAHVGRMLDLVADRGPRGTSVREVGAACLGHTALPLARGAVTQPYRSERGHVTVTYNGELYNGTELRRHLDGAGSRAPAPCDTALIAELVEAAGTAVIDRFSGMFALAVWDERDGSLTLARDRLGKKPLFYAPPDRAAGTGPVFASELDALAAHPGVGGAPDLAQVPDYLVRRSVAAPASMLRGVRKVGPGQVLTFRDGTVTTRWQTAPGASSGTGSTETGEAGGGATRAGGAARTLADVLPHAVGARLESTDSVVGVLFSGGVDSSVVGALAARSGRDVPAFGIVFSADQEAEVTGLAVRLGMRAHVWFPSLDQIGQEAHATLDGLDEPLADPSLVVTRMAARLAGEHTDVVLTGDGADELFYGYRYFEAQLLLARLRRVPRPLTRGAFRLLGSAAGRRWGLPLSSVATDLAHSVGSHAARGFLAAHAGAAPATLRALLHPAIRPTPVRAAHTGGPAPTSEEVLRLSRSAVFWDFLVDTVITKLDRATMAYGVEARSPFLDDAVVEVGLATSPAESGAGARGKLPVRALAAEVCGQSVAGRTKVGFRGPMADVLRGPLRERVRDALGARALHDSAVWDARAVGRMVDEHMAGSRVWTQAIWSVLVLETWLARPRTPGVDR